MGAGDLREKGQAGSFQPALYKDWASLILQ
jgi:hypothetical protein